MADLYRDLDRASHYEELTSEQHEFWSDFPNLGGQSWFAGVIGMELEEIRLGYARMRLPFSKKNLQPAEVIHGGALATVIDTVVVPAIGVGIPPGSLFSTIELHVQYHRPVVTDVVAEGWVVRQGRSVVFSRAEVFDDTDRLVASGTATYAVKPAPTP